MPLFPTGETAPIVAQRGRRAHHLQGDAALVLWLPEELHQTATGKGCLPQVLHPNPRECAGQERIHSEAVRDR